MAFYGFRDYVPVAQRRLRALKEVEKLKKRGRVVSPVAVEGRKIAASFWGGAWCDNLERYSDFETRLPRGRTYLRNGSVVDLQIGRGKVEALVSGSEIYKVRVEIAVAAPKRWTGICRDCAGSVGSLVELLQGKLSKNVMERVCREADGLFPTPGEIRMSCSCPDWADMCKHVAATLYGVGPGSTSIPISSSRCAGSIARNWSRSAPTCRSPALRGERARARGQRRRGAFRHRHCRARRPPLGQSREERRQARGPAAGAGPAHPKKPARAGTKAGGARAKAPAARSESKRSAKATA